MQKFKFYFLFACMSLGTFITGCDDDDATTNSITITIEEPIDGETKPLADCADVHVHIDFVATVENHEVEVVLHPEGDVSDKIIDYDEHAHDQTVNFEQEVDLCSYPAGTCFHLEVSACIDHDCVTRETAEAEFCIQ